MSSTKGKGSKHCQFAQVRLTPGLNGVVGVFLKTYTIFVKAEFGIEACYEYFFFSPGNGSGEFYH